PEDQGEQAIDRLDCVQRNLEPEGRLELRIEGRRARAEIGVMQPGEVRHAAPVVVPEPVETAEGMDRQRPGGEDRHADEGRDHEKRLDGEGLMAARRWTQEGSPGAGPHAIIADPPEPSALEPVRAAQSTGWSSRSSVHGAARNSPAAGIVSSV